MMWPSYPFYARLWRFPISDAHKNARPSLANQAGVFPLLLSISAALSFFPLHPRRQHRKIPNAAFGLGISWGDCNPGRLCACPGLWLVGLSGRGTLADASGCQPASNETLTIQVRPSSSGRSIAWRPATTRQSWDQSPTSAERPN